MSKPYSTLNKLSPESFLTPSNFVTDFDKMHDESKKRAKYLEGLKIGSESKEVFISQNTTWGAVGKGGGMTTSYEGIGYHALTAHLLQGFIDSGCKMTVYREGKQPTIIKD